MRRWAHVSRGRHAASSSASGIGRSSWMSLNCRTGRGSAHARAPRPGRPARPRAGDSPASWIGIERHRIVGPDAVRAAAFAPVGDHPASSSAILMRLACTKGTERLAWIRAVGQLVGGAAAILVQRGAAFLGEALDAGFDRDAAGPRRAGPASRASRGRCGSGRRTGRSARRAPRAARFLGQEDLVDEVDV
jgi:hypothetical protein